MPLIDHVFIELNGVYHICLEQSQSLNENYLREKSNEEIFTEMINYINILINKVKPRKSIFIAVDGVAPIAK